MSRRGRQLARSIKPAYRMAKAPAAWPVSSPAGRFAEAQSEHRAGNLARAEELYRGILANYPQHASSVHFLGMIAYQRQQLEVAAERIRRSIELDGGQASFRSNYGMVLQALGRFDESAEQFRAALVLAPGFAAAHNNFGNVLLEQGKLDDALCAYRRAFELDPGYVEARTNIGVALTRLGHLEEAIAHYRLALGEGVRHAPLHYNLGNALAARDRHEEALAQYREALLVDPSYVDAHHNMGVSLQAMNRLAEALPWYERTLQLWPGYAKAHFHMGMIYLLRGDLPAGWPHYESRHLATPGAQMREFAQPQWRGEPLLGRRILLRPEQGLGDTLQFLRYVPLVQRAGGRVVLLVQPSLRSLAAAMPGLIEPVEIVEHEDDLPLFDLHCPLLSLPLAFGTTLETIPARVPYLAVPEGERKQAAARSWPAAGLRVGLVWAGNPVQGRDRFRSLPLAAYKPLLTIEGVHFFSCQAGSPTEQLRSSGLAIADLEPDLTDMADMAAKLLHLDLVITVCTSVAHLAGGLGVRTWVVLPDVADWRWFLDREDSPWYPTMRLFRQTTPGDWSGVVERVAEAMCGLAEQTRADRLFCVADDLVSSP